MRFIGDVHGFMANYLLITDGCDESIQLGDMGFGFVDFPIMPLNHTFIRGNHDNPQLCRQSLNWIPDGLVEDGMMFIGGAFSIDKHLRTPFIDWWPDEELSVQELQNLIDRFETEKPAVMITHDCPSIFLPLLHSHHWEDGSRTRAAFNTMLEIHRPDLWIFGHHHVSMKGKAEGVEFIALAELAFIDITI